MVVETLTWMNNGDNAVNIGQNYFHNEDLSLANFHVIMWYVLIVYYIIV